MLSRELFGADLALPDFPTVKAIRGIGLSDFCHDRLLAEKLDYRNTHYHKEPQFDIVNPGHEHAGAYDFLISSEVFEHVAPPADTAFRNAAQVLKPHGILLLTVPYTLEQQTAEHFPALHDYGLAQLKDRIVLVNRTAEGQVQVFEDLCFHGGHGSTLEIRRFNEQDLRQIILDAGFHSLQIYAANYPPFGIVRTENWSLPIAARKRPFVLNVLAAGEIFEQWTAQQSALRHLENEYRELKIRFEEFHAWATGAMAASETSLKERTAWAGELEQQLADRTTWALSLEKDLASHAEAYDKLKDEHAERTQWALNLKREVEQLQARVEALRAQAWVRLGGRLGLIR